MFDATTQAIRDRANDRRRPAPWLAATFTIVETMDEQIAAAILDQLLGKPLTVYEADLCQMLSQKLGRELRWRHIELKADIWQDGRHHEEGTQ